MWRYLVTTDIFRIFTYNNKNKGYDTSKQEHD